MIDLTARQVQILRAVVQEFIETAEAVGSETLDKKYNMGVSPATIRNDMVQLTKLGYLQKPHSSAGRTPTPLAMKLYIRELMKEKDLSVADEVSMKERVWSERQKIEDLLRASCKILGEKTDSIGLAVTADAIIYSSGYAHLLRMPEFYDIEVMRNVLSLIEEFSMLTDLFKSQVDDNPIKIIFGAELGNKHLEPVSIVFMDVNLLGQQCYLGVIGSNRFDYQYVVPMMRYFRNVVKELVAS